jgi:molecular chaperone GrpE
MSKKHTSPEQPEAVSAGDAAENLSAVENEVIETVPVETKIETLEKELTEANLAKDEMYNRMLRIQADFDNFRRRSRQELEQLSLYGGEELLKKILPVLDSLERAVLAFGDPAQTVGWQEGVQLTLRQFQTILETEGLAPVEALNQAFDPQVHEAVLQEESAEVSEPTVVQELQKGYKYKDKLLRPSLVKVAIPAG